MLAGNARDWLAHFRALEERMVEAIEAAWPVCIEPLQPLKSEMTHEDHITNHLVAALIKGKRVPGRILPQYSLLTEGDDHRVTLSSNIDFVLTVGDDEAVYLACECKRLNVPYSRGVRRLVWEYVDDGLMRFVSGQYSNGLPLAMMLGYVMNGHVDTARHGLRRAMSARSTTINLKSTRDNTPEPGRSLRFVSVHGCLSGYDIEISHTLLSWP